MRILMLGTGPFAAPTLKRLHESQHEVVAVVTRPPRGRRAEPPPMQLAAELLQLPVEQPQTVNSDEFRRSIQDRSVQLLVVCDYGEILKPATLAATELGGVNLHGSLLPKYRGAAPVQWAILNGEQETGNTVIQMTPGLDAGPCLGVQRVAIDPDETSAELEQRLAELGGQVVVEVADQLESGTAAPVEQDASSASKAPRLTREHGRIDWNRTALQLKNQVRALQPWPRAYSYWQPKDREAVRLIILRATVADSQDVPQSEVQAKPGVILSAEGRFLVGTADGFLEILDVQPAGKRAMSAAEFLRGYKIEVGDQLGEA